MSKFWMMGGAVIAVSVAAMVWNPGPVRSSEDLLGKAQSEFAMKARDALIQRRMAQASTAPASTEPSVTVSAPQSVATKPYVVASLEPVAPPMSALVQTRSEAIIAEAPTAAPAPVEAPVVSRDSIAPSVAAAAPTVDATPPMEAKTVSLPEAPQASTPPQQVPAATQVSEPTRDDTPAATPAPAKSRQKVKTAHKTKEPMASTTVRRSERTASRNSMPYNLDTLRARAPEIAAAIARYM